MIIIDLFMRKFHVHMFKCGMHIKIRKNKHCMLTVKHN